MSCLFRPVATFTVALTAALLATAPPAAAGEPTPALPQGTTTRSALKTSKVFRADGWSQNSGARSNELRWVRPARYQEADQILDKPLIPRTPPRATLDPADIPGSANIPDAANEPRPMGEEPMPRSQGRPQQRGAQSGPEEIPTPGRDRSILTEPEEGYLDGHMHGMYGNPGYPAHGYGEGYYAGEVYQPGSTCCELGCCPDGSCAMGSCGVECGCGGAGCANCYCCPTHPGCWNPCWCRWCWWENLSVFGGVTGFESPVDLGLNGNFGFSEGLNWSVPLFPRAGIAAQFGFRAVQADHSGDSISGTDSTRTQFFGTMGVFRRNTCGFQYGFVTDLFRDNFYDDIDLVQYRAEISLVHPSGHEIGFFSAFSGENDEVTVPPIAGLTTFPTNITVEPMDQYAMFYRYTMCDGGHLRIYGGGTSGGDGLIGADFRVALSCRWALAGGFGYVIPDESGPAGISREAWGVGLNLEWFPGCVKGTGMCSWLRPLFNVADNSTFFLDRTDPEPVLQ